MVATDSVKDALRSEGAEDSDDQKINDDCGDPKVDEYGPQPRRERLLLGASDARDEGVHGRGGAWDPRGCANKPVCPSGTQPWPAAHSGGCRAIRALAPVAAKMLKM